MVKDGIEYSLPKVTLLNASPLWVAECAGRTAYNSFANSEHIGVKLFPTDKGAYFKHNPDIESSELLTSLAWVHHHHSVIELVDISFHIEGTSRGVLQEHARHRIQSLTVKSTRYTMSSLLNAYIASYVSWDEIHRETAKKMFTRLVLGLDMFVITSRDYLKIETDAIYDKLTWQMANGEIDFVDMLSKDGQEVLSRWRDLGDNLFDELEKAKTKRNVGDKFKHIVTDNWKVDMVVKFNLRSLKNYFDLRDSGAAYFQIQWLAEAMKEVMPDKYKDLIIKRKK